MTAQPPSVETPDEAALPADPAVYRRRTGGVGYGVLAAACVASVAAGVLLSRMLPARIEAVAPFAAAPAAPAAAVEEIPAPEIALPAPLVGTPVDAEVADLSARVRQLEAGQARAFTAASAALASSALIQASQSSRPFAAELLQVETLMPGVVSETLRQAARRGAPTRPGLARAFPAAAAKALAATRTDPSDNSLPARVTRALSNVVSIRRIDNVEGDGPHAILARAEMALNEGDVEGALEALNRLPKPARDALAEWRTGAERRAEIDRRIAAIRAASIRALDEGRT